MSDASDIDEFDEPDSAQESLSGDDECDEQDSAQESLSDAERERSPDAYGTGHFSEEGYVPHYAPRPENACGVEHSDHADNQMAEDSDSGPDEEPVERSTPGYIFDVKLHVTPNRGRHSATLYGQARLAREAPKKSIVKPCSDQPFGDKGFGRCSRSRLRQDEQPFSHEKAGPSGLGRQAVRVNPDNPGGSLYRGQRPAFFCWVCEYEHRHFDCADVRCKGGCCTNRNAFQS